MRTTVHAALAAFLGLALVGCAGLRAPFPDMPAAASLMEEDDAPSYQMPAWYWRHTGSNSPVPHPLMVATRQATERLAANIPKDYRKEALLVGTVVNVNHVGSAAPLGRALSEQVVTGLVAQGYVVVELRLREAVALRETTGELLLSRDVQEVAKTHRAALVVVGTYTAAAQTTFVNLKAIRSTDGVVEAAVDFMLPHDPDVRRLLGSAR